MAKRKRGASGAATVQVTEKPNDAAKSRLKLNSYEDVADSEDEFLLHRDHVLLDDGPDAKRKKQWQREDELLDPSDEEVMAYEESDLASEEIDSDEYEEDDLDAPDTSGGPQAGLDGFSDEEGGQNEQTGEDEEGWGPSKADYYDADIIETEQDALDEEAEARRIQQKQLRGLKEADFRFDEQDWVADGNEEEGDSQGKIVTEVLPQLIVTENMGPEERMSLLRSRYPEFEPLAQELLDLQQMHRELATDEATRKSDAVAGSAVSTLTLKFQALSAYLGALAMYFAIFTSAAEADPTKTPLPMPVHELRDHGIMTSLVQCRDLWTRVKELREPTLGLPQEPSSEDTSEVSESAFQLHNEWADDLISSPTTTPQTSVNHDNGPLDDRTAKRIRDTEKSLTALNSLLANSSARLTEVTPTNTINQADDSDIGDEPALLPHEAAAKARTKKSLRFYTSQIAQKANKRANAGHAIGGDDDLPYRERFRDRQARLNEAAERRGADSRVHAEGSDGSDGEDGEVTNLQREQREQGDVGAEYTRWLAERTAASNAQKQSDKLRKTKAYAAAHGGEVIAHETGRVGADGRREIGYAIEKNKGLMPRRKKEAKNPRVKKKLRYEDKKKKLASIKPMWKGGEGKGGYGGELTGIKSGLVRGVKL